MHSFLKAIELTSLEQVRSATDELYFRAFDNDPQMILAEASKFRPLNLPRGKCWLLVQMRQIRGTLVNPVIYLDLGAGFSEDPTNKIVGRKLSDHRWFFPIDAARKVRLVRFDPTEQPATFALKTLFVVSESTRAALSAQESVHRVANYISRRRRDDALVALGEEFQFPELPALASSADTAGSVDTFYRKYFEEHQARVYACKDGRYFYDYAGLATDPLGPVRHDVKSIAFYLPQMHPIPENDAWWGKGFTEWTNVSKAVARFAGHYQPRLPAELGFYDLRLPEVIQRQAELANLYGVYGFCFYFYWFSGKKLLYKPLEIFLSDKTIGLRFCLCWANENWTRRWDGLESDVLIAQKYSDSDAADIFADWLPYFEDKRYIKVGNAPVISIYRPDLIPDFADWTATWRALARNAGFEDLYIIAASAFRGSLGNLDGLDALYEFPPHNLSIPHVDHSLDWFDEDHKTHAFYYPHGVDAALNAYEVKTPNSKNDDLSIPAPEAKLPLHPGILVGWDNEARKPGRGDVLHGATPTAFRRWALGSFEHAKSTLPADRRFVFINAWNEWAEGAYLEPDRRHGYGFLTALRTVVREFGLDPSGVVAECKRHNAEACEAKTVAIFLHLFYFDLLQEFVDLFDTLRKSIDFDLVLTVPQSWQKEQVVTALQKLAPRKVLALPNVGRDVFPFLEAARLVKEDNYIFACKLHSKKSTHRVDGEIWRQSLVSGLLSNETLAFLDKNAFQSSAKNFIAAPDRAFLPLNDRDHLAGNVEHFTNLVRMLKIKEHTDSRFIAGTMFWFRFTALLPVIDLRLGEQDFGADLGQVDGTLAHAMERIFALAVESGGGDIIGIPTGYQFAIRKI